jgi:NAD(P)-dependent dehydrogenase (short-subunit alcohol dehydrogenase family)
MMTTVTIVTGAASGIGAACAQLLCATGVTVLGVDRVAIGWQAPALHTLCIDICDPTAPAQICDFAHQIAPQIAGFVNAAGIMRVAHPFAVDVAHWDSVMGVNAKATWFLTSAVLQAMMPWQTGSVVLLASTAGKTATTVMHPIYNISKAAVIAMTKTMAHTVAASGIRVNCVCPGVIDTPMQSVVTAALVDETQDAALIWQQRLARVPVGRSGAVSEVAAVVQFLLSEQASFVHGQAINVCGGMVMQ